MSGPFPDMPSRIAHLDALPAGNTRGKALEQLVVEMFATLSGVSVAAQNAVSGTGEPEFDVLLTNKALPEGLEGFARDVLVECKSSEQPLGSRDVTHFLHQAEIRHSNWSILVSLSGITGDGEDVRAANAVVDHFATRNIHLILLIRDEIALIRSAQHLSNVVEKKRADAFLRLHASTLTSEEISELDPKPPGVRVVRGVEAFQRAVRRMHDERLLEVLDRALELERSVPVTVLLDDAEAALQAIDLQYQKREEQEAPDPFMHDIRELLIEVGACFANLLDEDLADDGRRQQLLFDVRHQAPQRQRAFSGTELWALLTAYRLKRVSETTGYERYEHVAAILAMVVEEMIAIDDIDPADVYGQ